jgi:hypothetical protein
MHIRVVTKWEIKHVIFNTKLGNLHVYVEKKFSVTL